MTAITAHICVYTILLVCLYMSIITTFILIKPVFTVACITRIRKLVIWMFFVSVFILLIVADIIHTWYPII